MAIEVDTKDCTALSDAELAEMADLCAAGPRAYEAGLLSKQVEEWVLITLARENGRIKGFSFCTLERIGGTPSVLVGLASIKRTAKRDTVLRQMMTDQLRRAVLAFPDEDVLVGTRLANASGFEAFRALTDIVPRPDYVATGEERAWGKRLAKRFGVPSGAYDERAFKVKGERDPGPGLRSRQRSSPSRSRRRRRPVRRHRRGEGRRPGRLWLGPRRRPGQAARHAPHAVELSEARPSPPHDPGLRARPSSTPRSWTPSSTGPGGRPRRATPRRVRFLVLDTPAAVAGYWDLTLPAEQRAGFAWPGLLGAPRSWWWCWSTRAPTWPATPSPTRWPPGWARDVGDWTVPYWWVDAGAAIQDLLLGIVDAGLVGCLFGLFRHEEAVLRAHGVPDGWRAAGTVALGHPDPPGDDPAPPGRSAGRAAATALRSDSPRTVGSGLRTTCRHIAVA